MIGMIAEAALIVWGFYLLHYATKTGSLKLTVVLRAAILAFICYLMVVAFTAESAINPFARAYHALFIGVLGVVWAGMALLILWVFARVFFGIAFYWLYIPLRESFRR